LYNLILFLWVASCCICIRPMGPKHVVRQRSKCVNKHNSCDCRYLV
jgi:hypothetical protein